VFLVVSSIPFSLPNNIFYHRINFIRFALLKVSNKEPSFSIFCCLLGHSMGALIEVFLLLSCHDSGDGCCEKISEIGQKGKFFEEIA
jgi:hypothetical protein